MIEIVPALLVESADQFEQNLRAVENACRLIQVDVLDGTLFPNTTWWNPVSIGALRTNVQMEVHLMVENPIPIVSAFKQYVPTFARAIVSAEMHRPLGAVVGHIKDILGIKVGVAINPETPLHEIEEVLHQIDQLTLMGVHPGFQEQTFGDDLHMDDPEAIFEKIAQARNHRGDLPIEIDGGVTDELVGPLIKAGVTKICVGSLIFRSKNPGDKLKELCAISSSLSSSL
jgi:ribulose-phosphate 3-epimerase